METSVGTTYAIFYPVEGGAALLTETASGSPVIFTSREDALTFANQLTTRVQIVPLDVTRVNAMTSVHP